MAPTRSTLAGAKRKGETLSFSEGSKKGKEKATEDSILFMGKEEKDAFFKDFSNREVIFGRTIDFPFFNQLGIHYEYYFKRVGWFPALMIKDLVYPTLVQHCYTNLSLENNSIHSKVKGVRIILDHTRLNSILGAKNEGVLVNNSVKKKVTEGYQYVDALRLICDNSELTEDHKPSADKLSMEMRVLHHILNHIIVRRNGKFEYMSYLEMYLMWAVVTGKATNLGHLMIHHMADCKKGNNFALPYGMFLTTIFKELKVDLEGERSEKMDPIFYGEKTLRDMGYVQAQGTWVLKKAQDCTPTPAPTTQSEPESSSGPAFSSLSGDILECLKGLSAHMSSLGDRLVAMEAKNAEKFEALTARINEIEAMNAERIKRLIESQGGVSCQVREVYNDMTTLKKQQRNCIRAGSERVMEMSNAVTALKASYARMMESHEKIHDADLKEWVNSFMIWWYQEFNRRFPDCPPHP